VGVPKFNAFVPEEMRKYGKIREKQKKCWENKTDPKQGTKSKTHKLLPHQLLALCVNGS